jgi:uncharacterized membrane protein YfcA
VAVHVAPLTLSLLVVAGLFAGTVGAMVGIGGGLILIPVLVLGFSIPIHVAVATSLVAVVATSLAAGSVYVGEGLANMRLGMTLELATTLGAIGGGLAATVISGRLLSGIFAGFTLIAAILLVARAKQDPHPVDAARPKGQGFEARGELAGVYFDERAGGMVPYHAERLPVGMAASFVAGGVSGLLGVGGGFLKVPAMHLGMKVPIKVAAATSNFMIGVTAAASLAIYYQRGFVQPLIASPVAVGVAVGALAGTKAGAALDARMLGRVLAAVLLVAAVQMALNAAGLWFGG